MVKITLEKEITADIAALLHYKIDDKYNVLNKNVLVGYYKTGCYRTDHKSLKTERRHIFNAKIIQERLGFSKLFRKQFYVNIILDFHQDLNNAKRFWTTVINSSYIKDTSYYSYKKIKKKIGTKNLSNNELEKIAMFIHNNFKNAPATPLEAIRIAKEKKNIEEQERADLIKEAFKRYS